jgi:hypothetical protein
MTYGSILGDHALVDPGNWKLNGSSGGTYVSAEAILDDGWIVE